MYYADPDNNGYTMTTLTRNDYKTNYQDVITESGKNCFLGMILDNNNQIERAFSCGVYNSHPFCIEGTVDGSKYTTNSDYLFRVYGECDEGTNQGCSDIGSIVRCYGSVYADADADGDVIAGDDDVLCRVTSTGSLYCDVGVG